MMMMTTTRGSKVCHNDTSLRKKSQSESEPEPEPEPEDLDTGKLVLKKEIGTGTDTVVHYGVYGGQEVAVKIYDLKEKGATTIQLASLRTTFTQEISIWRDLNHYNICKFIGVIKDASKLKSKNQPGFPASSSCVVSAFQSGGTLKSYLIKNSKRKLPFKTVIKLAIELASGLSYLHSKKIVHRDIKTENILLGKRQTVKITDFGVARVESSNPKEMEGCTGTLGYMAPEVFECKPYNRKCDVYSFGICLWEIYCCNMPYRGFCFSQGTPAVIYKNTRLEIPKGCPNSLAEVMKKCWDLNPDKRPEMQDILSTLEDLYGTLKSKNKGCFCWRP